MEGVKLSPWRWIIDKCFSFWCLWNRKSVWSSVASERCMCALRSSVWRLCFNSPDTWRDRSLESCEADPRVWRTFLSAENQSHIKRILSSIYSFCLCIHQFSLQHIIHSFIQSFIYLSAHPSIQQSIVCPSFQPSIHCLSVHSFIHSSVRPSIHPSIHLSIYPSIQTSINISIHLHPSVHPSIH